MVLGTTLRFIEQDNRAEAVFIAASAILAVIALLLVVLRYVTESKADARPAETVKGAEITLLETRKLKRTGT